MKEELMLAGSPVVLLLAIATPVAWADSIVTYYACVSNSSGILHMVGQGDNCRKDKVLIQWSQVGLPGPQRDRHHFAAMRSKGLACLCTGGEDGRRGCPRCRPVTGTD